MVKESELHVVAVTAWIAKDNKFLLVKRSLSEKAFPGKWGVPGGKVQGSERISDALKREILEETGVEIKNARLLHDYEFMHPEGKHVVGLHFVAEYAGGQVKLGEGLDDFAWVSLDEVKNFDAIEGYERLVERVKNFLNTR